MIHRTLISTDLLAEHLRGDWVIVDCRFDLGNEAWGRQQYRAGHIPGAVYASLREDLAGPRTGSNGRHPLPSAEALAATLGRFGITADSQVIAYDQDSGMYASRLWWLLRYAGHDAVAILDGGWAKWTREGRPAAAGDEHRHASSFAASPRPALYVDAAEVLSRLDHSDRLLVDARSPERFEGRVEPIDRTPGHIPGAVNHSFRTNLAEDGTMLPAHQLREAFLRVLNGRDASQAVMYCGSGVTACHNLLAMEHAGLPGARLYPGSWSEWSSDPDRPIEKGASSP
jgi:thiosulfate/3-mercaptopyruvate sulfurtransferase